MVPRKKDNPNTPISPIEISEQVRQVTALGITSVHLHARDENEDPAWERRYFEKSIELIRSHSPDLVICVTTSGRTVTEFAKRADSLEIGGDLKPDMGSLTLSSMNFAKSASMNSPEMVQSLAQKMLDKGIKPELEVFDTGMLNYAKYLVSKGVLRPPFVVNILMGAPATVQSGLLDLGLMVERLPKPSIWLGAGIGAFQLESNVMSLAAGGGVRVGLEDNIHFDQGKRELATNFSLVERVVEIGKLMGKRPMSPLEFRELFL